jgi:hypothetical protein
MKFPFQWEPGNKMNPKLKVVLVASTIVLLGALTLALMGRNPVPLLGIGAIATFMLSVLWDMPAKHKTFTWKDQQKALFTSTGGNPPPEIPKPEEREERDKEDH